MQPLKVMRVSVLLWLHTQTRAYPHVLDDHSLDGHGRFSRSPLHESFLSVIIQNWGGGSTCCMAVSSQPGSAFCAQYLCWLTLKREERITYCGPVSCKRFPNYSFPIWISPLASKLRALHRRRMKTVWRWQHMLVINGPAPPSGERYVISESRRMS